MRPIILSACILCLAVPGGAQGFFEPGPKTPPSSDHAMAFDTTRGVTVMFGGIRFEDGYPVPPTTDETWEWNGTWVERNPVSRPPARSGHTMAYDASRGEVILFGGVTDNGTWIWDGTDWTERTSTNLPPPQPGHGMCFDSGRARVVLAGGHSGGVTADTWEWDGTDWTLRSPAHSPPSLQSSVAYDAVRGRSVLVNTNGETWEWDGSDWTLRSLATSLPLLSSLTVSYDAARARTVLVAALRPTGFETWEWDGVDWVRQASSGTPRIKWSRTVYDATRQRVVKIGGTYASSNPFLPREIALDVDLWDGTSWSRHTPRQFPPVTSRHAMAYDAARAEVVVFGGQNAVAELDDTWVWDGTDWMWRDPAHRPAARSGPAMAYATARNRLVLFGGEASSTVFDDTWTWDGNDWTQRAPAHAPAPRSGHAMAYDAARDEVVLFGGHDATADFTDTWVWDGTDWQPRTPAVVPAVLHDPVMVYDALRRRIVLVGGPFGSAIWEWDGTDWAFAAGGSAHAAAYDALRGLTYLWLDGYVSVWNGVEDSSLRQVPTTFPPPLRTRSEMAYHAATDRVVIFGATHSTVGGSLGWSFNETWLYAPSELALFGPFGVGCAGSAGVPVLDARAQSAPRLGETFAIEIENLPPSRLCVPFGVLGFSRTANGALPLPFDMSPFGMTGCTLYVSHAFDQALGNHTGTATWELTIPTAQTLLGLRFFTQVFVVDASANPLGVIVSNAGEGRIGSVAP